MSSPPPTSPVTPVAPPPQTPVAPEPPTTQPPTSSTTPPPSSSTSPPPTSSTSPPSSSTTPPPSSSTSPPPTSSTPPPSSSTTPPPTSSTPPPTSSTTPPPTSPTQPPTITPSPPPPPPTTPPPPQPQPVPTPSPPPPQPVPTPSPPPPVRRPPPSGVPASPPPPDNVPTSPPPPVSVPASPPPPNSVPASPAVPPPSPLIRLAPPPPSQSPGTPSSTSSRSPPSSSNNGVVVGVSVAVGAVVLLGLATVLIYIFARKRRRRSPPPSQGFPVELNDPRHPVMPPHLSHATSTTPSSTPPLMHSGQSSRPPSEPPMPPHMATGGTFAYDDLAAATDGFSDANLLGQGGFGHVYRGTVGGGHEVAIKKLRAGSGQGDREFRAEVEIISRVHHKNLVSLVGYCIHGEQRLLVYEYVPNKTLQFHLHGSSRPTLDWPRRWKIAVGSAKGLAYLHEDCHPKIIHRDIKAANILLDYNYEPKVADFGLAKYQAAEATAVSTRVMGTFGYLAPEYAASGKVSDRSDVFSFGVMLLELITGKKPIMTSSPFQDETLVSWAGPLLTKAIEEDNYEELIDPKLEANYDAYDMARLIACAAPAVRQTARSRPRMTHIVRYLEGELSVEDLNAGVKPGQSGMHRSSGGTTDQISRLRRMAFGPRAGEGTGTITEYTTSDLSEPTSEYGQNPSSSAGDTGEVLGAHERQWSGGRLAPGDTERMSRRTTFTSQPGRGGRS